MRPVSKGGVGSGVKGHETAQPARQSDKERKNSQQMAEALRHAQEEIEAGHRFRADRYKIQSFVNFFQMLGEEEKREKEEKRVKKGGPGSGRHPESGSLPDGCSWETPKDWKFVGSDRVLNGSTGEPTDNYILNYLTSKDNAVQVEWSKDSEGNSEAWSPSDQESSEIVSALDQLNPEGGIQLFFSNSNFGGRTAVAYYENNLGMAAGTRPDSGYQHQILIPDKGIYKGVVRHDIETAMGGEQPDHFSPFSSTREYDYTHYQVGGISTNSAEVAFNTIAHELGHYAFERDMEISYSDKAQDGRDEGFHWDTKNLDKLVPVLSGMAELAIEGNEFWNRQEYLTEEERDSYYEMTSEAYWKERFSEIQYTERNHFGKGVWDYTGGFNQIERQMLQEAGMTEYGSKNPAEFVAETYAMATNRAIMTSDTPPPVVDLMKENFPRWNVIAPISKGGPGSGRHKGSSRSNETDLNARLESANQKLRAKAGRNALQYTATAREENQKNGLEALSELGYRSLEDYQKEAAKAIKTFVAENPVSIRVPEKNLDQILQSGKILNGYESKTSERKYWGKKGEYQRYSAENVLFGLKGEPDSKHPVYGYIDHKGSEADPTMYGGVKFVLKDSVKNRTTVTIGDSLDMYGAHKTTDKILGRTNHPLSATDPQPSGFVSPRMFHNYGMASRIYNDAIATLKEIENGSAKLDTYVEAQIHGGVSLKDIERVEFDGEPTPAQVKALTKLGISFTTPSSKVTKGGPGSGRHKESDLTQAEQQAIEAWTENCDGWGSPSREELEEIAKRANKEAPELWRGINVDVEDYPKLIKSLQVGETVKLPFSSWSRKKLVGEQFASDNSPMGNRGDNYIVFHIPQGARGVNAEPYAIEDFKYQAEWLIPESSFKVVSVTKDVPYAPLSEDPTMPEWTNYNRRLNNYVLVELEPL